MKVPESAAVNESVKLAKGMRLNKASGFINGVLRSFVRAGCAYKLPDKNSDRAMYYSVYYSMPKNIVNLWLNAYGEENTLSILENLTGRPPVSVRVNTLKTTASKLKESFERSGIGVQRVQEMDNALLLSHTSAIEKSSQ